MLTSMKLGRIKQTLGYLESFCVMQESTSPEAVDFWLIGAGDGFDLIEAGVRLDASKFAIIVCLGRSISPKLITNAAPKTTSDAILAFSLAGINVFGDLISFNIGFQSSTTSLQGKKVGLGF